MRIISGKYKGKTIDVYKYFKDRPTTDFAKEGLFDILSNYYNFENISVCDLFTGTGSIAMEFASRGTENIICVDINRNYISHIQKIVDNLFPSQISTLVYDAIEFIKDYPLNYDVIFADPPYNFHLLDKLPELIFDNISVPEDSIVIIEHSEKFDFSTHRFFRKHRRYGKINFSFFSKSPL